VSKRRKKFNPHRLVHNIKFWAIEIIALIVFLNWAGRALWHELGFDAHAEAKAVQTCVAEQSRK
jgi:hypothetical protein